MGLAGITGALQGVSQGFGTEQGLQQKFAAPTAAPLTSPAGEAANASALTAAVDPAIAADTANISSGINAGIANQAAGGIPMAGGMDAGTGAQAASILQAERGGLVHPMAHHAHPIWPLLHSLAGAPHGSKPSGEESIQEADQPQGFSQGGLARSGLAMAHPPMPANFGGARPPPPMHSFEHGGSVRGAAQTPVIHGKRQALPIGPNSGIVPASTEGQMVTMDHGGPVPGYDDGGVAAGYQMMQPTSPGQSPMIGGAAGLAQGFTSGVATGHNIAEMWQQHQYRSALADQAKAQGDVIHQGLVAEGAPQNADDQHMSVTDHVHHFFSSLHDTFLGHDQDPRMAAAVAEHNARMASRTAPPQQGVPAAPAGAAPAGAAAATPEPPPLPVALLQFSLPAVRRVLFLPRLRLKPAPTLEQLREVHQRPRAPVLKLSLPPRRMQKLLPVTPMLPEPHPLLPLSQWPRLPLVLKPKPEFLKRLLPLKVVKIIRWVRRISIALRLLKLKLQWQLRVRGWTRLRSTLRSRLSRTPHSKDNTSVT
jgi:hypothetical protein